MINVKKTLEFYTEVLTRFKEIGVSIELASSVMTPFHPYGKKFFYDKYILFVDNRKGRPDVNLLSPTKERENLFNKD